MKMAVVAVTVAVLMTGCGHSLVVDQSKVVPAPAGAEQATELSRAFFNLRASPTIYWYGGDALGCGDGTGYTDQTGTCVNGDQDGLTIIVSDRGGLPLHETGLTHELAHIASDERAEGGDADHMGHFYRDPGEDLSQGFDRGNNRGDVGAANRMLEALGL